MRPSPFFRAAVAFGIAALLLGAGPALADMRRADPASVDAVLRGVGSGDTVLLAPGRYAPIRIEDLTGTERRPLTLRAADPTDPPILAGISLRGAAHVRLADAIVEAPAAGGAAIRIDGGRDIAVEGVTMIAPPGPHPAPGFQGTGLHATGVRGLTLAGSRMAGLRRGVLIARSEDVLIEGSTVEWTSLDGFSFAEVQNLRVENNVLRDPMPVYDGHPDMIQVWTRGTTRPSTRIAIRGNVLNVGRGYAVQSIFMRNEAVDAGGRGRSMFYRDVTIEENVVIGAHLHGISVGAAEGVLIRRNTLARAVQAVRPRPGRELRNGWGDAGDPGLSTPQIRIDPMAVDVAVLDNVAPRLPTEDWREDWIVAGNVAVQDRYPGQPDHYDVVFASVDPSRPARVADYAPRPGGPLDGRAVGAARLRDIVVPAPEVGPLGTGTVLAVHLDPAQGAILSHAGARRAPHRRPLGAPWIETDPLVDAVMLSSEESALLYGATAFRIRMRLQAREAGRAVGGYARDGGAVGGLPRDAGDWGGRGPRDHRGDRIATTRTAQAERTRWRVGGEVLRLHQALVVRVGDRGTIEVDLDTAEARLLRIASRAALPIRDPQGAEVEIAYDAATGRLTVTHAGRTIAEGRTRGPMKPLSPWGLSFGNPWGEHDTFEGWITAFELHVRRDADHVATLRDPLAPGAAK